MTTETEWDPKPWAIDPEHGRARGPGYLGDAFHSLRVRELFRYYQPPTQEELRHLAPINTGGDYVKQAGLISSPDPILSALANLTTRVMDMRRCIVSMTGAGTSYVIAESTRTLSLQYPHTHDPEDAPMMGGGIATSSLGGLCEHTCSLLPPPPGSNEAFLLEIPDLSKHPKFCNVGYVRGWPHARFYCGAPIRTKNGVTIGTVCIMDERPRYKGLSEKERMNMSNMAELFMKYFEMKEGDQFRKTGQMMETELSRFIAEGFLPSDGAEITERRNGKLWSESILESRRKSEELRRQKVAEKRQTLQEMEYSRMLMENPSRPPSMPGQSGCCSSAAPASEHEQSLEVSQTLQAQQGNLVSTICDLSGLDLNRDRPNSQVSTFSSPQQPALDTGAVSEEPQEEEYVPIVHPLQPGIIEMVPAALAEERKSLLATIGSVLPGGPSELKQKGGMFENLQDDSTVTSPNLFRNPSEAFTTPDTQFDAISPFGESGPETHASSSVSGTIGSSSDFPSTTAATSLLSQTAQRKRSKYEESTSVEPHFRAMFARASSVIKNTIGCDVVFVDADLEGFFEPEMAEEDPFVAEEWGWSHVSSDDKTVSELRAKKPKRHKQKSGILGYATSKGSSSARFDGPKKITDLGFDMSELNEALLQFLLKDSEKGKIFSFFDEYPGLEEHEDPEELKCKEVLQKYLPGCRSVIVVPLYDHNQQISAVCFAWTCSDQKTFYGDKEGRFVSGVASSVMNEMARIQILSADKAKSEFISSISHELRSPLHGILASAEFLLDGLLRPDQRSFVETIISCGTTLLDTVNHVLDFQKLNFFKDEKIARNEAPPSPTADLEAIKEEHTHSPHREGSSSSTDSEESLFNTSLVNTDLSTIVQEVTEGVVLGYEFKDLSKIFGQPEDVKKAALTAPSKVSKIEVIVDIEEREAGWVFLSNPAAMKRIVGNLVGNAVKYSHESGWIKITLAARSIDPASSGAPRAKVVLIVSDSGKGMSREFLKTRLFTPFTQENPMASGAGLGLSIVRQLVEMLDGTIDVKSQLGKGTTFRVEMRLTQNRPGDMAKSDIMSESVLSRTTGRKAFLIGFERFDSPNTPEQRAQSLLYDSFIRYAKDLFHMEIIFDPNTPDARDCQVIVINEMTAAPKLHELLILKDRPVVLLCNSTPRRSVLKEFNFDRDLRYFTFMRKPCGPTKLMAAFQFCFDILETGLPSSATEKEDDSQPASVPSLLEPVTDPADVTPSGIKDTETTSSADLSAVPLGSPEVSVHPQDLTINLDDGIAQAPHREYAAQLSAEADAISSSASTTVSAGTQHPMVLHRPGPSRIISPPGSQQPSNIDDIPRQPNLLCVEDNRINMVLLTTYLKKKKYPLKMACDGAEAVGRYKQEVPSGGFHCILMDLQMPIMSGIEATREIRALEAKYPDRYKKTFIIALTGLAAGSDRREAFNAGVDAFMVKPVSFKDLEKILDEHVRNGIMITDDVTPKSERKRNSIVSMESSRGKAIEIKRQVTGEMTPAVASAELLDENIKTEAGT